MNSINPYQGPPFPLNKPGLSFGKTQFERLKGGALHITEPEGKINLLFLDPEYITGFTAGSKKADEEKTLIQGDFKI